MEFGIQFFPDIGPKVKAADRYFAESLQSVRACATSSATRMSAPSSTISRTTAATARTRSSS